MKQANLFFSSVFITCQVFGGTFNILDFGAKGDRVLSDLAGVSNSHFLCDKVFRKSILNSF